jgi:hypothetical protein
MGRRLLASASLLVSTSPLAHIRLLVLAALLSLGTAWAGEYDFDIPEATPKPYTLGGRLEARTIYHAHDEGAARYHLNAYAEKSDPGADTHEAELQAELKATYRQGIMQANVLTHHAYGVADGTEDSWDHLLYEGYLSLSPAPYLSLDGGKKRILWGKGYAWNPVGFINRPKDPDDPALNLEGRTLVGGDLIKSLDSQAGGLTNLGLTFLLLPVADKWANQDLGDSGDLNAALKLYLLWRDTDIDLIYVDGPALPISLGVDVAKNLAENIEVHAEAAWRKDAPRTVIAADGGVRKTSEDQFSFLMGTRYLNRRDTTFIAEYYHNGAGYNAEEMEAFFDYQAAAIDQWRDSSDSAAIQRADQITLPYYRQRNFGRDYGYLKISQKEPLDILYLTPWVALTVNLHDTSFNLQPGLTWTPVTNLELNLRIAIPVGAKRTEYGEKADDFRPEIWGRLYF